MRLLIRVLACQLLPAGWLLFSAASASALSYDPALLAPPSDEPAPMCDPDGASVAAQDTIPEIDRGRFEALPCEAQLLLSGWQPDAPELGRKAVRCGDSEPPTPVQHAAALRARPEGACQSGVPFPERWGAAVVEFGDCGRLAASPGHARVPFRPPVVRA